MAPLALQLGHPALEPGDLGPLAVAIALELAEEVCQRRRDQAHDGPAGPRDDPPGGTTTRRGCGVGQAQRRQRRVAGGGVQLGQEPVGVRLAERGRLGDRAQYAPLRPSTTGIVRAMIVRSSQIDQVSM